MGFHFMRHLRRAVVALAVVLPLLSGVAQAEDGYDLWLRYHTVEPTYQAEYQSHARSVVGGGSPMLEAAASELVRGFDGLLGQTTSRGTAVSDGAVVLGTFDSALMKSLGVAATDVGDEGFVIRTLKHDGQSLTVIAANTDKGVLYGAFRYLSLMQTRQSVADLNITDKPAYDLRMLNHWDNLSGTVERGYSGHSIWDWWRLPDIVDVRYTDYARANASIGINATVLTNVNANAQILTPRYLEKVAAIADALRPYGIRVFLTARFSAPIEIGGLATADPLDPAVRKWWADKTTEIYSYVPDFGGFLVKANSEGQPGPQDYKRTHADGANMLAAAVGPHNGIVIWRAFVYSEFDATDRHKQANREFEPLDGQFAPNVMVQVKNGAIDFQPREPFHPLFGAMPKTPLMLELQITKEYLGFSTHLAYLAPMWEEVLKADTYQGGEGNTVAKVIATDPNGGKLNGIAGVANIGTYRNWTGSDFDQANWYAYGRQAWDPQSDSAKIAEDWARMTFSNDPAFLKPVVEMMMGSREMVADYMTPLGLTHLMDTGHHYGPGPWVSELSRPEWNPVYYHKADKDGIGFDRLETGSNAISQYAPEAAKQWRDPKAMDERYLLWFHHLSWDYKTQKGRTLWDDLVLTYTDGADRAARLGSTWAKLKPYVDAQRFEHVASNLRVQAREAKWWRDASIAYFQSVSGRPLPQGMAPPEKTLEYYRSLTFPYPPGWGHE